MLFHSVGRLASPARERCSCPARFGGQQLWPRRCLERTPFACLGRKTNGVRLFYVLNSNMGEKDSFRLGEKVQKHRIDIQ